MKILSLLFGGLLSFSVLASPATTFVKQYEEGTLLQHDSGWDPWRERTSDRKIKLTVTREDGNRTWAVFEETAQVLGKPRAMSGVVMIEHKDNEIVLADLYIFRDKAYCAAAATGQAADLGTTALGLSLGFAEGNPLGVALIPIKVSAYIGIKSLPLYQCMAHMQSFGKAGWAAAGWNLGFITGGPIAGAAGALMGLFIPVSEDDAALECAGC